MYESNIIKFKTMREGGPSPEEMGLSNKDKGIELPRPNDSQIGMEIGDIVSELKTKAGLEGNRTVNSEKLSQLVDEKVAELRGAAANPENNPIAATLLSEGYTSEDYTKLADSLAENFKQRLAEELAQDERRKERLEEMK
jgi:hypothetical protein